MKYMASSHISLSGACLAALPPCALLASNVMGEVLSTKLGTNTQILANLQHLVLQGVLSVIFQDWISTRSQQVVLLQDASRQLAMPPIRGHGTPFHYHCQRLAGHHSTSPQ